jgi:hypothetical protein
MVDDKEVKLAKKLKYPWQGPYEVVKQVNPNVVKLRHDKGNQLGQNVHVNKLKLYKEKVPEKTPVLGEEDEFNPKNEATIDNTELQKDEAPPPQEIEVVSVTKHKISPTGKLEYWTIYSDKTQSWQVEDNFYSKDGTVTEVVKKYYEERQKPSRMELQIQIMKCERKFASPKSHTIRQPKFC